jgi:ribosomal protein S19
MVIGPYIVPLPLKEAREKNIPVRTNARSCTILPNFVGLKFQVHNGKEYVQFEVVEDMVGTKLGEYAATRSRHVYKGKK